MSVGPSSASVGRPSVTRALADLKKRVRALEATLASLVATDTLVWPVGIEDNPLVVSDVPCTLVACAVSATGWPDPIHVLLFNVADVDDIDASNDNAFWVVPGPSELGAVPYVPIVFDVGVCAKIVHGVTGDEIIFGDAEPLLYVTFAFAP